jgi:hypothetical protein
VNKPAQLIVTFDKLGIGGTWLSFVEDVQGSVVKQAGDAVVAGFQVKAYDLTDHQFMEVTATMKNKGKDITILIPRSIIVTVIQGAHAARNFYFAVGTTK